MPTFITMHCYDREAAEVLFADLTRWALHDDLRISGDKVTFVGSPHRLMPALYDAINGTIAANAICCIKIIKSVPDSWIDEITPSVDVMISGGISGGTGDRLKVMFAEEPSTEVLWSLNQLNRKPGYKFSACHINIVPNGLDYEVESPAPVSHFVLAKAIADMLTEHGLTVNRSNVSEKLGLYSFNNPDLSDS